MAEPRSAAKELDVQPRHLAMVKRILNDHVAGFAVWAFGSRTQGTAKPWSDLDLVVISETQLDLGVCAALQDAFSESDLPWRVDVVDWATTAESFRRIIERDKIVLQPDDTTTV